MSSSDTITRIPAYPPKPPRNAAPRPLPEPARVTITIPHAIQDDQLSTGAVGSAPVHLINNPNSARVRRNWVSNLANNYGSISRKSKLLLWLNLALTLSQASFASNSQLSSGVVVLFFTRDAGCDQPLRIFIIVHLVKTLLQFPLVSYEHLQPSSPQQPDIPLRTRGASNYETPQISSPTRLTTAMDRISPWLNRTKRILDLFATGWFIVGNYWLFSSVACSRALYYMTMTFIIIGYIILLIPIILCTSVVFCLPCVLVGMRWLRVDERSEVMGANPDVVKSIPILKYRKKDVVEEHVETSVVEGNAPPKPPRLFVDGYTPDITLDDDDAVCVICLNRYVDGENLRRLYCMHHYHRKVCLILMECLDEWLRTNKTCPLCVRNVSDL